MKVKFLLISILQNSHRNLSILSLYAALKEKKVDVQALFLPQKDTYSAKLVTDFIKNNQFNVVGISVMTDGTAFAKQITDDIKNNKPDTMIIWGGIHPTLVPEECLQYADFVCVGEGEKSLWEFVQKLESGQDLTKIPSIGVKLTDSKLVINPPQPLISDLDNLPFVTYDWENFFIQDDQGFRTFDLREYARYSNYNGEDYTLMTSRSCPFSCSYCCNSFLNKLYNSHGAIRKRGVNHVIAELKYALANIKNIKFINFIDDQFLTSREWNEEFINMYTTEIGLPFIVRMTPDTVDDIIIKKLANASLKVVQVGIQSGSESTHKEIFHRHFNREKLISASKIFSKNKVSPIYDVIIQNDLETDTDRNKTIELLLELKKPYSFTLFALTPYPKTELVDIYNEKKITARTDPYGKGYSDYQEDDFYFQLCSIIPFTPHFLARYYYLRKYNRFWRYILKWHYFLSKNYTNKRRAVQGSGKHSNTKKKQG